MMKYILIIIATASSCYAQHNKHWDIANYKRVSFSPATMGAGCLTTTEGVACISNASGVFLFSTNGVSVYNSTCAVMANGTGLFGGISSTQSAIIIPLPNSSTLYYVFTADQDGGVNGIRYSIVDMSLSGSLGAVTLKNSPLAPWMMSEKLCAVMHCNNRDVWVIAKGWLVNTFTAWLVTPTGITISVASNVGHTPSAVNAKLGQLKANAQGNRIAAAYYGAGIVEMYQFNNSTGVISAPIMNNAIANAYGLEFSADGSKLYAATNPGVLYQFDLCNGNNRQTIINAGAFFGSIQNAIDGRMYIARGTNTSLSALNNPNGLGASCGFVLSGINTVTNSSFGLPNFISSYSKPPINPFTYIDAGCGDVSFSHSGVYQNCYTTDAYTAHWEYPIGTPCSSSITFPSAGTYNVSYIMNFACHSDTLTQPVIASPGGIFPSITIY